MNIKNLGIKLYINTKTNEPSPYEEGDYIDAKKKLNGRYKVYNKTSDKYYWLDEEDWNKYNKVVCNETKNEPSPNEVILNSISSIQEKTEFNKSNKILYKIIHKRKASDTPQKIAEQYNISIEDVKRCFDPTKVYNVIAVYNNVI